MKIAVLLPCLNEEIAIGAVVKDYRETFPQATVYVFDNCSTDRTSEVARQAGAQVVYSPKRGKGNVVQHMFASVDADFYIMADGDGTYAASDAKKLLDLALKGGVDMVCGTRLKTAEAGAFRRLHGFGNRLITGLVSALFAIRLRDILTGLRVMNREFAKGIPLQESGFEVETEMTLQALAKGYQVVETEINYGARPEGSKSKLNTFSDGFLIIRAIFLIFKDYKPLIFFSAIAAVLAVLAGVLGYGPIIDYIRYHYVYRVPLAILAMGVGILATISLTIGLILDSVYKYHQESYVLWRMQNKR
jgi:glycosyltransferase involved in cell wall biosynthesis